MLEAIIYVWGAISLFTGMFLRTRYYRVLKKRYVFISQRKRHFFAKWEPLCVNQSSKEGAQQHIYNDIKEYHINGIESRIFNQYVRILPMKKEKVIYD